MEQDKFISLKVIVDRVMMNPGMEDLPYDVALIAALDTIKIIANPLFLLTENSYIYINEYRGELPVNYVDIIKVNRVDEGHTESMRGAMTQNADPFFKSYDTRTLAEREPSFKYKVEGTYIFTSFEEGRLHVAYTTIPVDFDGTVMIPERMSIVKAVEYSVLASWLQKKWFIGKISADKFQWADRERNWYVQQASADFAMENLDKRQTIANIMNTLILNEEHSVNDYRELGLKEYRKNYL
jgi:hypothetical protein